MKYFFFLVTTVMVVRICDAQKSIPIRIGLITEGLSPREATSVEEYLQRQKALPSIFISPENITDSYLKRNQITHIWWLKDSETIPGNEQKVGKVLKHFVEGGGHLVLSMEAVRLLNTWGIEKNTFDIR